jgi:CHAT domain-containing protein
MKRFDRAKEELRGNQFVYDAFFPRNSDVMLSLLKTGRIEEATKTISTAYRAYHEFLGGKNYVTAEILGLRGMANAMMGNSRQAMEDFTESVPVLLKWRAATGSDYPKRQRLKIIVEAYLDLLTWIHERKLEKEFRINAFDVSFKLFDAISTSTVRDALGASGARAAAVTPDLADLVRREQDSLNQVNALQTTLSNTLAVPSDQQNLNAINDLKAALETLRNARAALLDEITRRFPKYSDFIDPKPSTPSAVQKHLRPGETLIALYPATDRTFVWAIPHKKGVQLVIVPAGKKDLQKTVAHLRNALDSHPATVGDIPEFDLRETYELYYKLLKPIEDCWKDAKDLVIITPGPLGQLPFSVLPTAPVKPVRQKKELFASYREVPWLIRKVSITRLPSVSSFLTLRSLPRGDPNRRAFVGFGDPFFNRVQLAKAAKEHAYPGTELENQEGSVRVRGIRITKEGNLDNKQISSSKLESLNRLPDTAEEIKSIAQILGADPARDIFLGKGASEHKVKTMNLSDRRVIVFASHALVPGDLDGLYQPALALASPSVTSDNEDGLLTMGEIMRLKLNSDWVVLSACNTGAAHGAGAEAVSGLGRAFFYAGTRAILVSMWPVETTSAKKLTTGLFRFQKEDKTLSRSRALRKSIIGLIDGPGIKDNATGKIIASYAHPIFWAPFIIVGDSGSEY